MSLGQTASRPTSALSDYPRSGKALVCPVGDIDNAIWLELPHHPAHAVLTILHAALHTEDLLAVRSEVRDDTLVAIVGERGQVNLDRSVTLIEQRLLVRSVPDRADASAEEHQVALFGREDGIVPIHDGQFTVRAEQNVASMQVRVAQNEWEWPRS